ncbi:hypothetical protein M885DRAFT_183269 [Pelagophyceae sp. CCMP2097]|nr:hypothetical protein M885DRAFT_183269 [Pelagophyceae sp. CCMP2097]
MGSRPLRGPVQGCRGTFEQGRPPTAAFVAEEVFAERLVGQMAAFAEAHSHIGSIAAAAQALGAAPASAAATGEHATTNDDAAPRAAAGGLSVTWLEKAPKRRRLRPLHRRHPCREHRGATTHAAGARPRLRLTGAHARESLPAAALRISESPILYKVVKVEAWPFESPGRRARVRQWDSRCLASLASPRPSRWNWPRPARRRMRAARGRRTRRAKLSPRTKPL